MAKKRRRRLFIVDSTFQIKYSLLFGLAGLVLSLIIGFVFYIHADSHDQILLLSGLNENQDAVDFLIYQKKMLLVKLSMIVLTTTLLMFAFGIILSNKVSGVVFSIRRGLKEISNNGDFSVRFKIRKNDELKGLVDDLNGAVERLDVEHSRFSRHGNA